MWVWSDEVRIALWVGPCFVCICGWRNLRPWFHSFRWLTGVAATHQQMQLCANKDSEEEEEVDSLQTNIDVNI